MSIHRIYVSKKEEFALESQSLTHVFKKELSLPVESVQVFERYDIEGLSDEDFAKAKQLILAEPPVDILFEELPIKDNAYVIGRTFVPGQYDQRADSTIQCLAVLTHKSNYKVQCAKFLVITGKLDASQIETIKHYYINPVDSQEASLELPKNLNSGTIIPSLPPIIEDFINMDEEALKSLIEEMGLAMTLADLYCIQRYFQKEDRNPTETEMRVLDTYWSDHCRHTTFSTGLTNISIDKSPYTISIEKALELYEDGRKNVAEAKGKTKLDKPTLMNMATMAVKELRLQGKLQEMDISEEINACTIIVPVTVDGKEEEWLLLFKNETHNHPTEIEPFGGAATCLGGCIRDPLSGRAYVYQAMRVTGSGDPRQPIQDTLEGKLPQQVITKSAARGYSSYGNQIGLATGEVHEYYHPGFIAKRMEIGAVVGAAPRENVRREVPNPGDVVILLGGETGRDGCGGATGSSKTHTTKSLETCGTEVQKGNPLTERKIQRLFRRGEVTKLIKRCNDFGAGGVSVAIGELADSLDIDLNKVPKKYEGLNGTELAISESQERMACVLAANDVEEFKKYCQEENVMATVVAKVTDSGYLIMRWNDHEIVNLSRAFLNTNGASGENKVHITAPTDSYLQSKNIANTKENWLNLLQDINIASQQGLAECFDSTIGAGTVLMPFGGRFQKTPVQGMVAKLPVLKGQTTTASIMTHGYDPYLACWSPFHGAQYAIVSAVSKLVALGGDYKKAYLTLQEYFEKLGTNEESWGKATAALLGAYQAQKELEIGAIGGKDSMSGTFMDLTVPPSLIAFAITTADTSEVISPELKEANNPLVFAKLTHKEDETPNWEVFRNICETIHTLNAKGYIKSCYSVGKGGVAEAVVKMALGNRIGVDITALDLDVFNAEYGSFILEISEKGLTEIATNKHFAQIGTTINKPIINMGDVSVTLNEAQEAYEEPLNEIFPLKAKSTTGEAVCYLHDSHSPKRVNKLDVKPKVIIPVFPGTNCEYDSARAFENAGGDAEIFVIRNQTIAQLEESANEFCQKLAQAQILMLPGGFSAGDEPDGSGKYIATFLRNPYVTEAVHNLLYKQDGLALGICNGFQALIKLGLLPTGYITPQTKNSPTLTYNTIGRHLSCMVDTKIISTKSPWMSKLNAGEIYTVPISHGEGRLIAPKNVLFDLNQKGQIATQYVDNEGIATYDANFNPNQSMLAIEGLLSPDGRILGKMAHSERVGLDIAKNIPGKKVMPIFESGIAYFK